MRIIGMDIHRSFAQVAILADRHNRCHQRPGVDRRYRPLSDSREAGVLLQPDPGHPSVR